MKGEHSSDNGHQFMGNHVLNTIYNGSISITKTEIKLLERLEDWEQKYQGKKIDIPPTPTTGPHHEPYTRRKFKDRPELIY